MKKMYFAMCVAVISMFMGLFSSASALTTTFFGEDLGLGEGTRLPTHLNSDAARADFFNFLIGVGTEDLEGFADETSAPLIADFGAAGTATLTGNGSISTIPAGTNGVGRYPISGVNYWEGSGGSNAFSITFSNPVAAFGFYGVDIGDFLGQITVSTIGGSTSVYNVGNTIGAPGGSVLYWGVIDTENPFTSISFGNTGSGSDFFGFDDFSIGSIEQVNPNPVPEPGILFLFGAGLAGISLLKRRN